MGGSTLKAHNRSVDVKMWICAWRGSTCSVTVSCTLQQEDQPSADAVPYVGADEETLLHYVQEKVRAPYHAL